jgi:hypothetical protein
LTSSRACRTSLSAAAGWMMQDNFLYGCPYYGVYFVNLIWRFQTMALFGSVG